MSIWIWEHYFFSCFREDESIDSSLIISQYKFIKVDSGHGISDCYWLQVILPKDITMTPYWEKIRFHPKVPFHFESLIRLFVLFVFSLFCIGFSVCFVYFAFVPTTHFSNFFRCKICQELLTHYRTLFIGCINTCILLDEKYLCFLLRRDWGINVLCLSANVKFSAWFYDKRFFAPSLSS